MWDALQTAHEGTTGVKDRRVEMLVEEFHKFTMVPDEHTRDLEIRSDKQPCCSRKNHL